MESELGSDLDHLELRAYSDFSDEEEEEEDDETEGRFYCTRSTRPVSTFLSDRIAQDKADCIVQKEKEKTESNVPKSTLFCHNVATIYTVLAEAVSNTHEFVYENLGMDFIRGTHSSVSPALQ